MNINDVTISGNITRDLELRKTQSGKSVLEFSIAVNEGFGDKQDTQYVNLKAWEKTAEIIHTYCGKGTKIVVNGKLKNDSYEKDGQKVYRSYVLVNNVEFLTKPKEKLTYEQTSLAGDRDVTGHMNQNNTHSVEIDADELPFY